MQTKTAPRKAWDFTSIGVNDYYPEACRILMEKGTVALPRGKVTRELHPTTVLLQEPRQRVLSAYGRMINLPFALAEVIQIITGQNDAQGLSFYNSQIIDIQGDGPRGTPHWELGVQRFNAAYGERLRSYDVGPVVVDQLQHVIQTLKLDPDSRQASMVLSHPLHDHYSVVTNDRACNVYAHAMVREGRLDWMQIIRSNDAIWGIPYNMMQWSHVQDWVASALGYQIGTMFIVQDSFHVYEDKYEECRQIKPFDLYTYVPTMPMKASQEVAEILIQVERNIRGGVRYDNKEMKQLSNRVGPYWASVIDVLQSYSAFKRKQDDLAFELLPEYTELRLPLLRNYCQWRWSKLRTTFGDMLQLAVLELSEVGIPHEEIERWLGIKPALS